MPNDAHQAQYTSYSFSYATADDFALSDSVRSMPNDAHQAQFTSYSFSYATAFDLSDSHIKHNTRHTRSHTLLPTREPYKLPTTSTFLIRFARCLQVMTHIKHNTRHTRSHTLLPTTSPFLIRKVENVEEGRKNHHPSASSGLPRKESGI
jgi:hypothetical protein